MSRIAAVVLVLALSSVFAQAADTADEFATEYARRAKVVAKRKTEELHAEHQALTERLKKRLSASTRAKITDEIKQCRTLMAALRKELPPVAMPEIMNAGDMGTFDVDLKVTEVKPGEIVAVPLIPVYLPKKVSSSVKSKTKEKEFLEKVGEREGTPIRIRSYAVKEAAVGQTIRLPEDQAFIATSTTTIEPLDMELIKKKYAK